MIKNVKYQERVKKLIFEMLLCIWSYRSWKIANNNVYRSWVALVSSVFPLLTTLFSKTFREE